MNNVAAKVQFAPAFRVAARHLLALDAERALDVLEAIGIARQSQRECPVARELLGKLLRAADTASECFPGSPAAEAVAETAREALAVCG